MKSRNLQLPFLYGVFILSGFCGLIYESIWASYLKLFLGHAIYGQVTVLIVFIGGMSIGAWVTGKFAKKIRNPLMIYALVEVIVGIISLYFHEIYQAVTAYAYSDILPATCSNETVCTSQIAIGALMILPQSILLGTTFPLMSSGALKISGNESGKVVSMLYFSNSLGAVFGVLFSSFLLIPLIGLPGSLLTAGIGNLLVAAIVYWVAKVTVFKADVESEQTTSTAVKSSTSKYLFILAGITGLASFIYEIAWIRMLSLVTGASTHSFELMLSSFILGLSLGGFWIKRKIDTLENPIQFLAKVQIIMGVLAVLTLPIYLWTFEITQSFLNTVAFTNSGYVLYTFFSKSMYLLVMFPATFMAGMTLPLVTFILMKSHYGHKAIGFTYSVNSIGSIIGVLLAVFVLMPGLGLKNTIFVAAGLDILLGIGLLMLFAKKDAGARRFIGPVVACSVLIIALATISFDQRTMASGVYRLGKSSLGEDFDLKYHVDGRTSTVHVIRSDDGIVGILTNGKSDGALNVKRSLKEIGDEETMTLTSAIPLAYRPDAKSVAQIGFGTGMGSETLLSSDNLEQLHTIEIEPAMFEAAKHFWPVNKSAYTDPRHQMIFDDAKSYFAKNKKQFDIIIAEPSNPWVSGVASLFTHEFYGQVHQYVADGGVFTQWVQLYEINPALVATIVNALKQHFPKFHIYITSNVDMIIVAFKDGEELPVSDAMFEMPKLKQLLNHIGVYSKNDLIARRIATQETVVPLLESYTTIANSDYYPVLDTNAAKARFRRDAGSNMLELSNREFLYSRKIDGLTNQIPTQEAVTQGMNRFTNAIGNTMKAYSYIVEGAMSEFSTNDQKAYDWWIAAKIFREGLTECQLSSTEVDAVLPELIALSQDFFKYLPKEHNQQVWSKVSSSGCLEQLSGQVQAYASLFSGIAADNYPAIVQYATQLVERKTVKDREKSLLYQSILFAHLQQNQHSAGQLLLEQLAEEPWAEQRPIWLRYFQQSFSDKDKNLEIARSH